MATRTRLWRNGRLDKQDFPATEISDYLAQDDTVVWLDLCAPTDLSIISDELGLDPLAIEDALSVHERAKLDRYPGYLFLNVYSAQLDAASGALTTYEISAFVTQRALVTVRPTAGFDVDELVERWNSQSDLARHGVAFL